MTTTPLLWRDLGQINVNIGIGDAVNDEFFPRVIHLADGTIIQAWVTTNTSGANTDIVAQALDPLGNAIGGEFLLNPSRTTGTQGDFNMAALPNGGFAVVFTSQDTSGVKTAFIQVFDANLQEVSISPAIATASNSDELVAPDLAVNSNGDILVLYSDLRDPLFSGGDVTDVFVRTFDVSTNSLSGFNQIFDSTTGGLDEGVSGSAIDALSNGNFVAMYGDKNDGTDDAIFFQLLNSSGVSIGGPVQVNLNSFEYNQDPHLVALNNGFVVVWETDGTDNSGNSGIRARVFNGDGTPRTNEISVSTTTAGNQTDAVVARLAEGGFVIAWHDENTNDIHGQRYDAQGVPIGVEFNIETNLPSDLFLRMDIEGLEDGRFVVSWEERVSTMAGEEVNIFSAIYDPRDDENNPNDYTSDLIIGTILNDQILTTQFDVGVYGHNGMDDIILRTSQHQDDPGFTITYDGGLGLDRFTHSGFGSIDLTGSDYVLLNNEDIFFADENGSGTKIFVFSVDDFGQAFASDASIRFGNQSDVLTFRFGQADVFDASDFTILNFDFVGGTDVINFVGDSSGETVIGTSANDVYVMGGGDDFILYSEGVEYIDGGSGVDTVSYAGANTIGVNFTLINGSATGLGNGPVNNAGTGDVLINIENIIGSNGNDSLTGDDNANRFEGGALTDTLYGRGGDDVLLGGDGNDTLWGQTGNDTIDGGSGNDTIFGDEGSDIIDGGDDVDTVEYGGLGVYIDLESGEARSEDISQISFATGDTLTNIENVFSANERDVLLGDGEANHFISLDGNDTLRGRGGDDILEGGDGVDFLDGGAGNNILMGGTGTDTLLLDTSTFTGVSTFDGGAQYDTLEINHTGVPNLNLDLNGTTINSIEEFEIHRLTVDLNISWSGFTFASINRTISATGAAISTGGIILNTTFNASAQFSYATINFVGFDNPDDLFSISSTSNAATQRIEGSSINDFIDLGLFEDTVVVGSDVFALSFGFDAMGRLQSTSAAGGTDTYANIENIQFAEYADDPQTNVFAIGDLGTDGADILFGTSGSEFQAGGQGNDVFISSAGGDALFGGANTPTGFDVVSYNLSDAAVQIDLNETMQTGGHAEGDILVGIEGVIGSNFDDVFEGNNAANDFAGGIGSDLAYGGGGGDTLTGEDGVDYLFGEAGEDTLNGDDGADWLYGGGDNDTLNGGAGADLMWGDDGEDKMNGGEGDDIM